MEALVIQQDIEPLPMDEKLILVFKNEGLLSSTYKKKTSRNFFQSNPKSIFGIKQRIKSMQYQSTSSVVTLLKLSVLAVVLAVAFA